MIIRNGIIVIAHNQTKLRTMAHNTHHNSNNWVKAQAGESAAQVLAPHEMAAAQTLTQLSHVGFARASPQIRFDRGISFGGNKLGVFLEVRNLMDRENILTFDNRNIPSRTKWEEDGDPTGDLNRAFTRESQAIYDIPRIANLGITVDF